MKVEHLPVLAEEVLTLLAPASGSLQIDATLGGGGHTERILEATDPDGRLLGLDADGAAIARVRERLGARFGDRLVLRQANFRDLATVAPAAGFSVVDGLLFDLGLSSFHLADAERGFGIRTGGPLDMRFDPSVGVPAAELLATLDARSWPRSSAASARSPQAGRIARAIVEARRTAPIETAEELAALVERVAPGAPGRAGSTPRRGSSRPCASPSMPSSTPSARAWPRRSTCSGRAAGWSSSATTRSRTGSSSGSWRPSARAASARPRSRSASAAGSRACACSPARSPPGRPRSPPIPAPAAPGCEPPSGSPHSARPDTGRPGTRTTTRPSPRKEEHPMSKRHQSSRRRSYGRRQHELRERTDRDHLAATRARSRADRRRLTPSRSRYLDRAVRGCASRWATSGRLLQGARARPTFLPPPIARMTRRCRAGAPGRPFAPGAARAGSGSCSAGSRWPSCWHSSRSSRASASRPPATRSTAWRTSAGLVARRDELIADLNRLGRGPAIRKLAIDLGLDQLAEPLVVTAR